MKKTLAVLLTACGMAAVVIGVAMVYIPAAAIIGGLLTMGAGLILDYGPRSERGTSARRTPRK